MALLNDTKGGKSEYHHNQLVKHNKIYKVFEISISNSKG